MSNNPIVVILPVYNGGTFLKESVQSVLTQSWPQFSFIITDDCSTDGSREWLRTIDDARVSYVENTINQGLFSNLNKMIADSTEPLIKLWAQDDIMHPDCLKEFVSFHHKYPGLGFSYSQRDMIDENGRVKGNRSVDHTPEIISTALHAKIAYFTGSIAGNIANTCIRRSALQHVGGFNESMKISADFDMWVRLAEHYNTGFINKNLIKLRDHTGQLSRNEKYYINHVKEDLEVYRYLDNYVGKELREEGRLTMRKHKLAFYYTLMVKAFLKGKWKLVRAYYSQLEKYDSFMRITIAFFLKRIFSKSDKV